MGDFLNRKGFNNLSVDDLEVIFTKIYENACELIEESQLLYHRGKYARSYLLAHISFEEFGKLPMLNTVALNISEGKVIDWKKLNKRIRDHKRKISQSYGNIQYLSYVLNKFKDPVNRKNEIEQDTEYDFLNKFKLFIDSELIFNQEEYLMYLEDTKLGKIAKEKYYMSHLLNDYKNMSLYADFDEGKFKKPSEGIEKEICEYGISLALIQQKFIELPQIHKYGFPYKK